jgi:hypothetical protein
VDGIIKEGNNIMVYANEMITVNGATGFTAANLTKPVGLYGRGVRRIVCTVETDEIRFRCDGSDPTSSVGHLMSVGDVFTVDGSDAETFKAIKVTNNAKLAVSYEI